MAGTGVFREALIESVVGTRGMTETGMTEMLVRTSRTPLQVPHTTRSLPLECRDTSALRAMARFSEVPGRRSLRACALTGVLLTLSAWLLGSVSKMDP